VPPPFRVRRAASLYVEKARIKFSTIILRSILPTLASHAAVSPRLPHNTPFELRLPLVLFGTGYEDAQQGGSRFMRRMPERLRDM